MPNTGLMGHTGLMVHMGAGENRKDAAGPRPATDPMRTAGNLAIVVALVTRKTQSSLGAGHGHVRRALKLGSADMSFDPKGEGSRANVDLRLGAMDQIGEVLRNHYPPKVSEKRSSPDSEVRSILEGWFGEALENMEDAARVKRYLFDPLCKAVNRDVAQAAISSTQSAPAQIGVLVRDLLSGLHRWTDNGRWNEYAAEIGKAVEARLSRAQPQEVWTTDDVERATKAMYDAEWGHGAWDTIADAERRQWQFCFQAGLDALTRPVRP
jgi:hypothetical protein